MHTLYAVTDDALGEIIVMEDKESVVIDLDIRFIEEINSTVLLNINTIHANTLNTDVRFLETSTSLLNLDIRFTATPIYEVPDNLIKRTDFHVYINGSEATDVDLTSITIDHIIDEKSRATFRLARKHDNINKTETGASSVITSNNSVVITIKGITEFSGKVSFIDVNSEQESVIVTAEQIQPSTSRNNISLPMPDLNEDLHPYHILLNGTSIDNPYINPNEEYPKYYKGVKVDLGIKESQRVSRYTYTIRINNLGLSDVMGGSWQPKQNWTYYWFADGDNWITGKSFSQRYIGTSLSPLTADAWDVGNLSDWHQREYENQEEELGEYTIGSAPYKDVNSKNGVFDAKTKWVDEDDGLYVHKDEHYNYEEFAKEVADIEYQKLTNINGSVLPITATNIELFIDGYYYYNARLMSRINIDNTETVNIYKNNNGFPVAIKSVSINSDTMKVTLSADNIKTRVELEELEDLKPDPEDSKYLTPEYHRRVYKKYDPNKGANVV